MTTFTQEIQMSDNTPQSQLGWDPLDGALDPEILSASAKRSIKNILKSYVGAFDPFAELIQNALDAVDKRSELHAVNGNKENYKKHLFLTIDLKSNAFTIVDNGVGFKDDEFRSFLAPSISFKDNRKSRGNKGVGATYIAYGFNHLEIGTKNQGFKFLGEITDGRNWVDDVDGHFARPKIKPKDLTNADFNKVDQGTIFSLHFGGLFSKPKDLSWYQATTADQWLYLLLTKTPLGGIYLLDQPNDITEFTLKVIDKNGLETTASNKAVYMYPHTLVKGSANLQDVRQEQDKLRAQGRDVSRLSNKYTSLNGVYEIFNSEWLKSLPTNKIEAHEIKLIDDYKISAYGYFSYSTAVWDVLNDNIAKLRKGYRFLRGGIQLANNSMIQGEMLVIPLTKSIGYQNQAHIVIHFVNADPDLGRKGFQPELKELAESISVGIVNHFKTWRHLLQQDKGNKPDIVQETNLYEWVKQEEEFEKNNPLAIKNPNFFQPVNEISISSEPQTEQDAIVLFSQLLAGGVIRGIKLLSTSQWKQYDGLYKFIVTPPAENHIYEKHINPLGVLAENYQENVVSKPRVLEYKYNLDALIHEFENGEKHEKDVSLAIVWDIGEEWKKNYEVISLLDVDNIHHRLFHGITHTLYTQNGSRLDLIILKELIQYLNDPDESDLLQKEKYNTLI